MAGDNESLTASYRAKGQAGLDRLQQSEMQQACSGPVGMEVAADVATKIQKAAMDGVVLPADGKLLGQWEKGQKIAQTGTGMQSSDDPATPNGGNCYACHQLAPEEISFGTLGPSLAGYGKIRGQSEAMLKYTWTRIWNSHAYSACSHMPRFGDAKILTEEQIRDVMAFLFDPASPVNK
ncbi:sulfur oxidation c-type cytochrome SoxX [Panacagrimonas perspica]|nr:sulfur oxidation c-type cytochrome SoxX [Panacagrimonas perspica]